MPVEKCALITGLVSSIMAFLNNFVQKVFNELETIWTTDILREPEKEIPVFFFQNRVSSKILRLPVEIIWCTSNHSLLRRIDGSMHFHRLYCVLQLENR